EDGIRDFHVTGVQTCALPILNEQVVHQDFFFDATGPVHRRGGALYKMGFMALPCLAHASFALGAGRRILDEWRDFARTKPRGDEIGRASCREREWVARGAVAV